MSGATTATALAGAPLNRNIGLPSQVDERWAWETHCATLNLDIPARSHWGWERHANRTFGRRSTTNDVRATRHTTAHEMTA
jgi:hypothetical protein